MRKIKANLNPKISWERKDADQMIKDIERGAKIIHDAMVLPWFEFCIDKEPIPH